MPVWDRMATGETARGGHYPMFKEGIHLPPPKGNREGCGSHWHRTAPILLRRRNKGLLILSSPCPGGAVKPVTRLGTLGTHSPGSQSGPTHCWGTFSLCASPPRGLSPAHPIPCLGSFLLLLPVRLSGALGSGGRRRGMPARGDAGS